MPFNVVPTLKYKVQPARTGLVFSGRITRIPGQKPIAWFGEGWAFYTGSSYKSGGRLYMACY